MQSRSILADVKNLAGKSVIYGLGSILLKVVGFFLLPLYTRYLTPADYGVIAVAITVMVILSIIYTLGLNGALTRFYFDTQDETGRRRNSGTIWTGMILVATGMTVLMDRLGANLFPLIFREVPFAPYIRLTIWIAFFQVFSLIPLNLLQIQERPGLYVLATVASTLLSIGLIITLVVFQKQGAYGYLLGMLLATMLSAVLYAVFTIRHVQITLRWDIFKAALGYSLPLVPHGLASWVLELSDRVILERYVSLTDLGLYAISYQFGAVMNMAAIAVNNAWVPFLFKVDAERGDTAKPNLARLATYYTFVLSWGGLGLALLVKDALWLLTTPAFYPAYRVAPWIIGGLLLSGLYYIPVNFLFLRSKTGWVPVVTVLSGVVNVGLNLWLAPRYGIMAAAWSTFLAYGVMLALVWAVALREYSFPYEYRRLGLIGLTVVCLFIVGNTLKFDSSVIMDLGLRGALLLAYPLVLAVLGFFTPAEKATALTLMRQVLAMLHRTTRYVIQGGKF